MAISVGDAVLKIGVDTKAVDKGLRGLKGQIMKHNKAIGLAMTAVGGTILAVGIKSIRTYAQMGDEVQKMALRTGFATESLSEWKHALEISGSSLQALDKGVKKMSKTIVDASDGLATYVRSFEKIGLTAEELMELKPEEQFEKIAMAIAGLESHTIKAAVAQEIFGRAGTELLPMLDAGAEGIAKLREEAHRLGIVFDQEAAESAARLTDAMHRLKEATSGVQIAIAEHLAPILSDFLENRIVPLIEKMIAWTETHPALARKIVIATGVIGGLLLVLGPLLIMLPFLASGFTMLGGAMAIAFGPIGLLVVGLLMIIIPLMIHWKSITNDVRKAWEGFISFWKGVGDFLWQPIQNAIDRLLKLRALLKSFLAWLRGLFFIEPGLAPEIGIIPELLAPVALPPAGGFGMQEGGIAMRPMLARIGELAPRIPEVVAPLDKLQAMLGGTRLVNIFVELDGRVLAKAIGQPLVDEIRLKTGLHI